MSPEPFTRALDHLEVRHLSLYATPGGVRLALGSGVAVFAGTGLPVNRVAGLGMEVGDASLLPEAEAFFAAHGAPTQVDVSSAAHPDFLHALRERGYHLTRILNTHALTVDSSRATPRLPVRQASGDEWLDIVVHGFGHDSRAMLYITAGRPGTTYWVCERDGHVIAGGALSVLGEFAQLFSTATHPSHRGHGAQASLLAARLAHASGQGARYAVVSTTPGSPSERNVSRAGFRLVSARLNYQQTKT